MGISCLTLTTQKEACHACYWGVLLVYRSVGSIASQQWHNFISFIYYKYIQLYVMLGKY